MFIPFVYDCSEKNDYRLLVIDKKNKNKAYQKLVIKPEPQSDNEWEKEVYRCLWKTKILFPKLNIDTKSGCYLQRGSVTGWTNWETFLEWPNGFPDEYHIEDSEKADLWSDTYKQINILWYNDLLEKWKKSEELINHSNKNKYLSDAEQKAIRKIEQKRNNNG